MGKLKLLLTLGWRNIWRWKKRSILVIAASMVGLTGVYLTMGFMNALKQMWVEGSINSSLGHVQIRPQGYAKKRGSKDRLAKDMNIRETVSNLDPRLLKKNIKGDIHHALRFERIGFLRLGSAMQGVNILGVEPVSEKNISQYDEWLTKGSYLDPPAPSEAETAIDCLLGKANAEKFEVDVDDSIVLSIGSQSGNNVSTRIRVKGIFKAIAEPMEKNILLIPREKLSQLFNETTDEYSYTIFKTSHRKYADQLKKNLGEIVSTWEMKNKADLLTYTELQPSLTKLLELSDSMMYIFYSIMLLGFAFILLNSVLMSVFERTREIGIIRAIGSSGGLVFSMVVLESLFLGLIGALAGLIFSGTIILFFGRAGLSLKAFSQGMELMGGVGSMIYPSLRIEDIYIGSMITLMISMLASLYPAFKAIGLQPIKAVYNR